MRLTEQPLQAAARRVEDFAGENHDDKSAMEPGKYKVNDIRQTSSVIKDCLFEDSLIKDSLIEDSVTKDSLIEDSLIGVMNDNQGAAPCTQDLCENLIANSLDAIISATLQGVVTGWNPAAERLFGYTAAEMIGRNLAVLVPPDCPQTDAVLREKFMRNEWVENYHTVRRRKTGEAISVSVTISPIRDRRGMVIGVSEIARNITENVKATQSLVRAQERYALVLEGMSVGFWDWDLTTNELFGSQRLRSLIGTPRKTIETYDQFTERLHPDDQAAVVEGLRAHLEGHDKFDMVYRRRLEDDHFAWVHVTGQAVWDEAGKPVRMAGSIEDITQRIELENNLVDLVEKLKKSNKDLDEFAYAASHDLKAPLRIIDNTSQWLMEDLEPHLTAETRENMNLLRSRVRRMEKLLGDLLEYSRIGRTQDERFAEAVNGGVLLENILALLAPKTGFSVSADTGFAEIAVMRMPLQQVFMNLVGNAIKHHDKNTGTVRLSVQDLGSVYEFTVEDDGPGIPGQFHDKVFEMFRTLRPRDQVEGSGMGLAMVRKNVEMFGGTIGISSNPVRGVTFRFTWPKSQPDAAVSYD